MQTWNVRELDNNRRSGDELTLNVYVRAERNARILLSSVESPVPTNNVNVSAPYYEVVLGAGSDGREFELLRNTGRLDRTTEKNVLDAGKWVLVEISLKSGGTIEVKVGGSKGAKLKEKDSHPIDVQFISFRSADSKLVSDWRFDC